MKGLKMSHGDSLIISKSKIKPEYREIFLTAKYFYEKPDFHNIVELSTFFLPDNPENQIEETIVKFLNEEQYDYTGKCIEYWFQHQIEGWSLAAHCDYNHHVRADISDGGAWIHTVDQNRIVSPITIGCYLLADNLEGGELGISSHTWLDEKTPLQLDEDLQERIKNSKIEYYQPKVDDVLYFEGSKHYHWIEEVKSGERKSMMINFWPARYALS